MIAGDSLGVQIRAARERRHMTQRQLAGIIGVDRKTVDNWENDRTTPRNRMAALVQWAPELGDGALEVPADPRERELYYLAIQDMPAAAAREVVEEYRRRKRTA